MRLTKLSVAVLLAFGVGMILWILRMARARAWVHRISGDTRARLRDSNVSYWLEQWRMADAGSRVGRARGNSGLPGVLDLDDENLTITQRVRTNLGRESALATLPHLNVNTESQGVVYLRGYVHNEEQRRVAQMIAANTEGVSQVISELNIAQAVNL
jgi:hypothetical protein